MINFLIAYNIAEVEKKKVLSEAADLYKSKLLSEEPGLSDAYRYDHGCSIDCDCLDVIQLSEADSRWIYQGNTVARQMEFLGFNSLDRLTNFGWTSNEFPCG